jgi:NAD(P)-dependent dehydrogenase (short-subunit alcohol dehydrogenase family)
MLLPSGLRLTSKMAEPSFDRREVLGSSVSALLVLLLGPKISEAADAQTVLITGSNSGIGFEASKRLAEKGHTVILGCRTLEKAQNAAERIRAVVSAGTLIPAECNLASLASVKKFASELNVDKLDVVCLNAGLALDAQGSEIQRSTDGFELTGE